MFPEQVDALLQITIYLLSDSKLESHQLRTFGDAFQVDASVVHGIIAISQKKFDDFAILAQRFGNCEPQKVELLVNLVENLRMLSPNAKENDHVTRHLRAAIAGGPENELSLEQFISELSYRDLFVMFDRDNSGDIDFAEFLDLTKYLQLNMSDNQAMKIFAKSAKADGFLNKDEFEEAMISLRESITAKALDLLELSTLDLVTMLLIRIFILICLFGFIFLGIAAFTQGTTLSAIINTVLTVVAAAGVNLDFDVPEYNELRTKTEDTVKMVFDNLKLAT